MKRSVGLVARFVVMAVVVEGRQAKPTLDALAWMAGSWSGTARGIEMEEQWTVPKGNSMIGMHRDVGKGRTVESRQTGERQPQEGVASIH